MKLKQCDCGCYAFLAHAIGGTWSGMCYDGGRYNHRFGPSRKTKFVAALAWNRWATKGFPCKARRSR
jgi:hypothetical protein